MKFAAVRMRKEGWGEAGETRKGEKTKGAKRYTLPRHALFPIFRVPKPAPVGKVEAGDTHTRAELFATHCSRRRRRLGGVKFTAARRSLSINLVCHAPHPTYPLTVIENCA